MDTQELFDGFKIDFSKSFETFQVAHSLKMGGHYEMGPQKQKAKQMASLQGGAKDQYLYELTATYAHPPSNVTLLFLNSDKSLTFFLTSDSDDGKN